MSKLNESLSSIVKEIVALSDYDARSGLKKGYAKVISDFYDIIPYVSEENKGLYLVDLEEAADLSSKDFKDEITEQEDIELLNQTKDKLDKLIKKMYELASGKDLEVDVQEEKKSKGKK